MISGNTGSGVSVSGTGVPAGTDWWGNSGQDLLGSHNLSVVGNVAFTPSVVGNAFDFSAGGYAETADQQPILTQTDNWSFETWVDWKGPTGLASQTIFSNGNGGNNGFGLEVWDAGYPSIPSSQNASGELLGLFGNVALYNTGVFLPINTPVHLGLVPQSGVLTLYVNGIAEFSQTTANPITPAQFGDRPGFSLSNISAFAFNGQIDSPALYSTPLSASQVQAIYRAGAAGKATLIEGNTIGLNATGSVAVANGGDGIVISNSPGNQIGGTAATARNVISGNVGRGVDLQAGSNGTLVEGNSIGTDAGGTFSLGNGLTNNGAGIRVESASNVIGGPVAGEGNVISGNTAGTGLHLAGSGANDNLVEGNMIGTNAAGTAAIADAFGIQIDSGATANTIGGSSSANPTSGTLTGAGNLISGNVNAGIYLSGATSNVIQGNYIGTNAAGTAAVPNDSSGSYDGIDLIDGSSNNVIGGISAVDLHGNLSGLGNVISANGGDGVFVNDAYTAGDPVLNTVIQGNFIGTDVTGTNALGNAVDGIDLQGGAGNTTIGGATAGLGNVISANGTGRSVGFQQGILIETAYGFGSISGTVVQGNFIGTNAAGTAALGNEASGVDIASGSTGTVSNNTIGGTTFAARNVISGNSSTGLTISANANLVAGNYIGTNASGSSVIGNAGGGLMLYNAENNTIGGNSTQGFGNLISGNAQYGVELSNDSAGNLLAGNVIGLAMGATTALGNHGEGVEFYDASGATVGGTASGVANVIAGNTDDGILFTDYTAASQGNLIAGNYIGTNASGAVGLGNQSYGVSLATGGVATANNTIGFANAVDATGAVTTRYGNVISGNANAGVRASFGTGNLLIGNFIGTNPAGTAAVANGGDGVDAYGGLQVVGGTGPGQGNLISGNAASGVGVGASSTVVEGNRIGTNAAGTAAIPNASYGIGIGGGKVGVTIGGTLAGAGNLISGNGSDGLNSNAAKDVIEGNLIGTSADGLSAIANQGSGIDLDLTSLDTIGGAAAGAGNLISGNVRDGIFSYGSYNPGQGPLIQGNFIGVNKPGKLALPNSVGIVGITGAVVGGSTSGAGNVISGNATQGVLLSGGNNLLIGNFIGTNAAGTASVANVKSGVDLENAPYNTIGGVNSGSRNVISGNFTSGIFLDGAGTTNNAVLGNFIGTDSTGTLAVANGEGIVVQANATANTIGGTLAGAGDVIAFNQGPAIDLGAANTFSRIRQNYIIGNGSPGILIESNTSYDQPTLMEATVRGGVLEVQGKSVPGAVLEFYLASAGQGAAYLGTGTEGSLADNNTVSGAFDISLPISNSITAGVAITAISVAAPSSPGSPNLVDTNSEFATQVTSDSGQAFGGPVVNAGGGGTVVAGSTFASQGSFTDTASASWTATVDYGDGSGVQNLPLNPVQFTASSGDQYSNVGAGTFNLSHVFAAAASYKVTVVVKDDAGLTGTSTFVVNVVPAPAQVDNTHIQIAPASAPTNFSSPTIINEESSVILTGEFTDPNPTALHTVNVIWGDGQTSLAAVNEAAHTFTATHQYLTPGTYNKPSGVYTVEVSISSNQNPATTSTTNGLFYVQVNDVPPTNLQVNTDQSALAEGGTVNLSGSFAAVGLADTHVVTIDWGDGSPVQTETLGPGVLGFNQVAHKYLDYPQAGPGTPYQIQVGVHDLYQPLVSASASRSVTINGAKVTGVMTSPGVSIVDEGTPFSVSGSFTATGSSDRHQVSINWGDGSLPATQILLPGVNTFSGISHTYRGTSLLLPGGNYPITVTVDDPSQPAATAGTATTSIIVRDVPSSLSGLAVAFANGGAAVPVVSTSLGSYPLVNAGTSVIFSGNFTTPNPADTYSLLVNWGDGTSTTVPASSAITHTFSAQHLYVDVAGGTKPDANGLLLSKFDIHVTATDSEQTTGTGDLGLVVQHVAPVDQIRSGGFNTQGSQVLSAQISGGDTAPITSYTWSIDGQTQTTSTSSTLTLGSLGTGTHLVQSTAMDSYGAASNFSAMVDILPTTSSTYTLANPMLANPGTSVDAVFVSASTGNDVIDGSGLAVPIIFDGNGQETYIGNPANDVFYLHTDGSVAIGGGGNNVFELTPNCTLQADASAGNNTLDFSSSSFGVTFDLSQTQGQKQDVDPTAAPGDHYVEVERLGHRHLLDDHGQQLQRHDHRGLEHDDRGGRRVRHDHAPVLRHQAAQQRDDRRQLRRRYPDRHRPEHRQHQLPGRFRRRRLHQLGHHHRRRHL